MWRESVDWETGYASSYPLDSLDGQGSRNTPAERLDKFVAVDIKGKSHEWLRYHSETVLAGYFRLGTSSELRQVAISWPVLRVLEQFIAWSKNLKKDRVFIILDQDSKLDDNDNEKLLNIENPVRKFPMTDNSPEGLEVSSGESNDNRNYKVAWVLHQLVQQFDAFNDPNAEENKFLNISEREAFTKKFSLPFPDDSDLDIISPNFGPYTEMGECHLEKYNRAWEILRYVTEYMPKQRHASTKDSYWHKRFVNGIRDGFEVLTSNIPKWLRPGDGLPEATSATAASQQTDHRVEVLVSWKRGRKFELASQLEEVFEDAEDRGKQIPPENQILEKNPAGFPSGESFRDYLKQMLNCLDLGITVTHFRMTYQHAEEDEISTVDVRATPWGELREIFTDRSNKNCHIYLKVAPVDPLDTDFRLFESEELLPRTMEFAVKPLMTETDNGQENPQEKSPETAESDFQFLEDSMGYAQFVGKSDTCVAPLKHFDSAEAQRAWYDGFDVTKPHHRREWQIKLFKGLTKNSTLTKISENRLSLRVTPEENAAFRFATQQAHQDGQDLLDPTADKDYCTLLAAFSGCAARVGPHLDICLDLLLCQKVNPQDSASVYRSELLKQFTSSNFYDYQVVGAVGILLKQVGRVDAKALLKYCGFPTKKNEQTSKLHSAAKQLQSLQTHGAIIADGTGFGKTKQCLLAALLTAILKTGPHKPNVLLAPPGVLPQWVDEIVAHWPFFKPVLSYEDTVMRNQIGDGRHLSATAMSNLKFPPGLRDALNPNAPSAHRMI
ncbi:unnamed protein product [Penicillium viridicatum]